ncbi:MAG: O-antigen ligase family protein, partial [Candidatus Dormibacteraeota bacterium]|nr:O-antigen ligase family protein [Candidatus Dormibacteraeota bacterium]
LILFLLTCALVRERRQVVAIGIVFVVTELMTGVLGNWRYFVTLQRSLGGHDSLLAHEDSYFLLLYLVALGVSLFWWRVRRLSLVLVLCSPLVLMALIQNNRRAGIDATAITFICFLILAIRFRPDARRWAILSGAVIGGAYAILAAASWHVQYGLRSELVSPIRSILGQATARDLSSDAYRTAENANLIFTYHLSPITGWGLGKDFLTPRPMVNISNFYSLWNLLPHNSLLWVPMSMGVIGLVTFWGLVGLALMESIRAIRVPDDRLIQGLGAFCVCAIVAELVFAYADLQLESPRNMVTWGILLGLVNLAPRLAARRRGAPPSEELLDGD